MDASRFSDAKTGQLVRITSPSPDWAFVPDPLPNHWEVPRDLFDLLMEAGVQLGNLNGIGRLLPHPELLLRPLREREAIQSSKLEGTYTTPEDLLLFVQKPREPKSDTDPANDWREVANYGESLATGYDMLEKYPFSLNLIRAMHGRLMWQVRGSDKNPGEFRKFQVGIGSDHRYVAPPPQFLPEQLSELEKYMNAPAASYRDRLIRPFMVHYQFEAIHPFQDGNGRIGRALLALMLYKTCEHSMPWLYLSPYFERHKDEYISRMFRVSTHGEWKEWISFCLLATIEQAKDSIRRCGMLQVLRRRYEDRLRKDWTGRTVELVDALFTNPVVGVSQFQRQCGVSYKTARAEVDRLVRAGIFARLPRHYPATYYAWEIFRIAYRDEPSLADDDEIKLTIARETSPNAPAQPPEQSTSALPGSTSQPEPSHP